MEYYTSDKINRIVGAPRENEYNMWRDDIWKNAPRISPTRTGWVDAPSAKTEWVDALVSAPTKTEWVDAKTSPIRPNWSSPQKSTPPKPSSEVQFKTPEKSENPPPVDLDTSPRTSTPVPDESLEDIVDSENMADQYECFKVHLNESPKKLKVRGAVCYENEIIAGHINMKNLDPFSYTFEQHYMPKLNRCFVNLLINGPAPLMCHEHYDPNYPNNFVSNCVCLPVCNCRVNLALNRNLPIGYKYNEHGFVVPTIPSMPSRGHLRDPNCIYTA